MTVTVVGFQGTIGDAQMAVQQPHHAPSAFSAADLLVTAVGGARTVSVAAGSALAAFVKYTSDAAQTLTLAAPASGGKWYAITLNRQWSPTNSCVLQADDLAVTDANGTIPTFPTAAAFTAAAALSNAPGTAGSPGGQRQILALVYVRAADTTLTIFDARMLVTGSGVIAAATFTALLVNNLRHFLNGALIPVLRHAMPSGGTHVASRWLRDNNYLVPAGLIEVDGSSEAVGLSAGNDIASFAALAIATVSLPFIPDSRLFNRNGGKEYAYFNSRWMPWDGDGTSGIGFGGTVVAQTSISGYDATYRQQLTRAGKLVHLVLSVNTGGSNLGQGSRVLTLPDGFKPLAGLRQHFHVMVGFANEQGWAECYAQDDGIFFYQYAPNGGGPVGQIGANIAMMGTVAYLAQQS